MTIPSSKTDERVSGCVVQFAAYVSAGLFFALFMGFNLFLSSPVLPLLGVAIHLILFPVVAALPAPSWAKQAGYGWLAIDILSNVMALNGADPSLATIVRYGGHVVAAVWIVAVSWEAKNYLRFLGLPLAAILGGYSLVAPWVPSFVFLLAFALIISWLVFAGRTIRKTSASRLPI